MRILRIYNSNGRTSGKYFIFQYYLDVRMCEYFVYYDVNIDVNRPQMVNESVSEDWPRNSFDWPKSMAGNLSIQIVYKNVLVQN